ncbi:MAG: hypothetical protein HOP21_06780 [Methylotenera sp.]|nr:hypothetical protein [Methylotenera sp.]
MAAHDSGLTTMQLSNLNIEHFIFHVIHADAPDNPTFLAEVTISEEQRDFFTQRLRDAAAGTQLLFLDESPHLKEQCSNILTDQTRFVELSRQVTQDFAGRHSRNSSDGIFVTAVVSTLLADNEPVKLIFFVKMDHKVTYDYKLVQGDEGIKAVMSRIANALVEDKAAIQKSALIDVSGRFSWNVLARDRAGTGEDGLTDYFRGFLGARMREDASTLTVRAVTEVSKWAKSISLEDMPPGEDVFSFKARAVRYMEDNTVFNTDAFINTVVRDEDYDRKLRLEINLREKLTISGVAGQTFTPRPNSIPKKNRKSVYETEEGVTIIYEGEQDARRVSIRKEENETIIEIRTRRLKPKSPD